MKIKNELNPEEDDDVVEFVFNDDGEEDLKATLKKFRADLKTCRKEKEEYLAQLQRERADFINYKKEEDSRFKRSIEYNQERFISDLLPVLDSYDMAFSNKEAWEKVDKNWRMGVEYIHQQILKVLAEYGVTPIEVKIGDTFDHNIHEPIETVETDKEAQGNTVALITQSGYKISERVLRPARVKIYEPK
jgi:molecular chaperone GrpE